MTSEEIVTTLREYDTDAGYAAATLIESQANEITSLKTKLAYAEDAAAKGDLARQNACGMEMQIAELKSQNERLVKVLDNFVTKGHLTLSEFE